MIAQSDTVVFVVSPEAVKSKECTREVDRAIELSKRLFTVIFKSVPNHDIPEKLGRFQFINFDSGTGFARPLLQLAEVLRSAMDSGSYPAWGKRDALGTARARRIAAFAWG